MSGVPSSSPSRAPASALGRAARSATAPAPLLLALEERVLLELALDVGRQLEIAQLQQLDRLLQLRRHHQSLALTHIQS